MARRRKAIRLTMPDPRMPLRNAWRLWPLAALALLAWWLSEGSLADRVERIDGRVAEMERGAVGSAGP